jgi:2-iminobutanoate/2-iminopropanoate deaminase|tara:strand:- start:48 stop:431 length:384 start_codon:yes stop_codon:yes gene_type:complete
MLKEITTPLAPQAIGPYSQAVQWENFIFCSGQIPLDSTGKIVDSDITKQTEQVLKNIKQILLANNSSLRDVVKTTIFLTNLDDFPQVNEAYRLYFTKPYPARSTIQVSKLPMNAAIEIEALAILGSS